MSAVVIVGPDSVAPGRSVRYTAEVRLSDGRVKIPTNVRWQVNLVAFPSIRVDDTGLVTGVRLGEQLLSASVTVDGGSRGGSREIVVVPEGTFRFVGTVRDAEIPTLRIAGARVEITPGPAPLTTDTNGQFRVYGVAPNAEIRISRSGYEPFVRQLQLATHVSEDIALALAGPRPDLSGEYSLSIESSTSCRSLQPELRTRRYDAVITQNGVALEVMLTEPRFRLNNLNKGNRFSGRADAGGAAFTLDPYGSPGGYYYYYYYLGPGDYPSVAERLADGTFLVPSGEASTIGTPSGLSGELNGRINQFGPAFPSITFPQAGCFPPGLRFTLTRR